MRLTTDTNTHTHKSINQDRRLIPKMHDLSFSFSLPLNCLYQNLFFLRTSEFSLTNVTNNIRHSSIKRHIPFNDTWFSYFLCPSQFNSFRNWHFVQWPKCLLCTPHQTRYFHLIFSSSTRYINTVKLEPTIYSSSTIQYTQFAQSNTTSNQTPISKTQVEFVCHWQSLSTKLNEPN